MLCAHPLWLASGRDKIIAVTEVPGQPVLHYGTSIHNVLAVLLNSKKQLKDKHERNCQCHSKLLLFPRFRLFSFGKEQLSPQIVPSVKFLKVLWEHRAESVTPEACSAATVDSIVHCWP